MRLLCYIVLFFDPFVGILLSFLLDFCDAGILYIFNVPRNDYEKEYHHIDKPLDYIMYLLILPLTYNTPIFNLILISLILRTVATFIYAKSNNRKIFVLIPNFVEYIYLVYLLGIKIGYEGLIFDYRAWIVLILFKLGQEIVLHIYGFKTNRGYTIWKALKIPQFFKDFRY